MGSRRSVGLVLGPAMSWSGRLLPHSASVIVAAAMSACGSRPEPVANIRDSAGVALVDSRTPVDGVAPRYQIDSAPVVDIGGGPDPHGEFTPGIEAVRLRGGQIVIAEHHELRWFDRRGRWLRSVGRQGSGPGEFRQINLLAQFGDSVLVYDFALRRVSVFDSAGNYGRGTTIVDADTLGETFPVGVLGDGRLLLASYQEPAPVNGLRRDSVLLRIGSPAGAIQAVIGRFPYLDQVIEARAGGISMSRSVFGLMAYWGTWDSLVLVAPNERFSFDWYGADGRLQRSVRRQWTPVPVTTAAVTAQIEEWLSEFPAGMEKRKAQARASWAAAPRREVKPPYGRVLVSAAGEVWVQEYGEPGQRSRPAVYSVFDRSGPWLGQVTVAAGVELRMVGTDEILAVWRDQDEVTHVRVYPLRQSGR